MKFKRLLSLVLSGFLITSTLTACSSGSENDSASNSKKVEIDIFQFKVEFKNAFEDLAKKYEKEHPEVKINITTVGGGGDYGAALKSKFASGNEPAIFNVGGPQDVKDWKKKLADLKDTKLAKIALKGSLQSVTSDNELLGLPFNIEGYGLLYNKEIFKKLNIDPKSINTYEKLEQAVKKIDENKKKLGLDAVFAFPAKETWVTGLHLSNPFISAEFSEDINKAFNSKTIDFKYNEQMKNLLDLQNNFSVQPTVSLDYNIQVEEMFSNQKVAIIQQGNWAYNSIEGIDEKFAQENVGLLPIPVKGYKEDSIPVGIPMYWAVNKNKDENTIKASKEFLDWVYTSETGKEIVLSEFKFIPAYSGYDNSKIKDPISKEIAQKIEEGKTINWVFMGYPSSWGMNKLGSDIQKYVSEKMTWKELVENAKKTWAESRES